MRSKYFKLYELVPKNLYELLHDDLLWGMLDPKLIETIDVLKSRFPKGTMTVNNWFWGGTRNWSGIRTEDSEWYSVGSQHSVGKAIDTVFSDYLTEDVRQYIISNPEEFPHIKGIELDVSWLHIDVRRSNKPILFKA